MWKCRAAIPVVVLGFLLLGASPPPPAESLKCGGSGSPGWVGEFPTQIDYDAIREAPAFTMNLDEALRTNKLGNACAIATSWLAREGSCSQITAACDDSDHHSFRVYDPWRADEFVDIPCRVLVEACATGGDREHMSASCSSALAALTGYVDADPGPISFLLGFACGLAFYGAAGEGCHASGADRPEVPVWMGGGSLCQFGAGTFLGAFACTALGFLIPF